MGGGLGLSLHLLRRRVLDMTRRTHARAVRLARFRSWQVYAVADGDQAVQFLKMRSVQLLMLDATPLNDSLCVS